MTYQLGVKEENGKDAAVTLQSVRLLIAHQTNSAFVWAEGVPGRAAVRTIAQT
jgi:hypothetical protein